MKRLNITLPEDLINQLNHISNKSKFIAEALREKLKREKKKKMRELLTEGYAAAKEEDRKINEEWGNITLEGWK